ncbi:1-aminocyclopropane-1-carboxylate synthase 3, partial [Cucurbita argyrosperma subsp. sororia]
MRLKKRQRMLVDGLEKAGIKCHKGNAGLFSWVDMRHLLGANTFEAEMELWRKIVFEVRLNVSPGQSCHCSEPGWFRVCFANMSEATLDLAMKRFKAFVADSTTNSTSNQLDTKRKSVAKWVFRLSVHDRTSESRDR